MKDYLVKWGVIVLTWCLMGTWSSAFGQQPEIWAKIDSQEVYIGSDFEYELSVASPEPVHIRWPEVLDTLGAFEVLNQHQPDSFARNGQSIQKQKLSMIGFDPGGHYLPAMEVQYQYEGDSAYQSLFTDSLRVKVRSMEIDTAESIKPIKDPLEVPLTFEELKPWLFWGGGILLLAGLIFWLVRRYWLKSQRGPAPKPERPPHHIAIEELQRLKSEELWQNGQVKEYHDRLTDILRAYIERVYNVQALEMTTNEIMKQMVTKPLSDQQKENLRSVFETADLAKFARVNPSPEDNDKAMEVAFEFVRETRPVDEEAGQQSHPQS